MFHIHAISFIRNRINEMKNIKKITIVGIALFVGALHFLIGPNYQGPFKLFVNGYLIDILLPFALYLLLSFFNQAFIRTIIVRALFVFLIGVCVETLQFFNVPIFGSTFDPLDYLMYGFGVLLAIVFETEILSKYEKVDTG